MAKIFPAVLKIITVEDSLIIVSRVECMLSDIAGVKFLGNACNKNEALALIEAHQPDVVMVDVHLGCAEGNGIDLLILIRKSYPAIKVIMLTNLTETRYRTLCLEAGADFFLDKSNDFDKIPETLAQILNLKRSAN